MSRPWVAWFAVLLVTSACHRAKATPGEGLASLDAKVVAQGDSIFAAISCARCHGAKGGGGDERSELGRRGVAPHRWLDR